MSRRNSFKYSNNALVSHQSSSSIEKLDGNFCGAFQEHYDYLMDKGLIETCQYSGAQTTFQSDYENMSGNVSFKEFLHQYNELKRWLEQMQSISISGQDLSSYCEKYTNQIFYEEILKRSPRRELLNEYACHLVKYHPHLKQDVLFKLNHLNNQWKSIEFSIISKQLYNEDITKDLKEDLKNFEDWLINVENFVENLSINRKWCLEEVENNMYEHKRLQSDIEAHARIINSVLKLSTKLKQSDVDCNKFNETALYLQNKWHCVWLMSLEWQCRLEQELSRKKKVDLELSKSINKSNNLLKPLNQSTWKYRKQTALFSNIGSTYQRSLEKLNNQNSTLSCSSSDLSTHSIYKQEIRKCEFNVEAAFNFFRITNSQESVGTEKPLNRQNQFLNKEIKQYLNDLNAVAHNSQTYSRDDIIPFDDSEYEKILSNTSQENFDSIALPSKKANLYSKSLNSLHISKKMSQIEDQTLVVSDSNLILNNSTESSESSLSGMNINNEIKKSTAMTSKMKSSRTESEICNKFKHSISRKNRKTRNSHTLTNNLSHYYSLTDVKYYNIDDNDDENILSTSSISTSSLSSSASFTSSTRSYSELSFDDDSFMTKRISYPRLQKSITLPNGKFELSTTDTKLKSKTSVKVIETQKEIGIKNINMSLSDYCMSSLEKAESNKKQHLKRRRRFINATKNQNENLKNKNGNEADDEEFVTKNLETKAKPNEIKQQQQLTVTTGSCRERLLTTPDELASTINSDVSWDGYNDSPYYSNSATNEDMCINKKTQPILPWDELFFELDPLEDLSNNEPNKKIRSRRSIQNVSIDPKHIEVSGKHNEVINQQHFHYYYHHHHHYAPPQESDIKHLPNSRAISYDLNKLTEKNLKIKRTRSQDSITSSENTSSTSGRFSYISSSNSPNDITSNFENDFTAHLTINTSFGENFNKDKFLNRAFNAEKDMDDIVYAIDDSIHQWGASYELFVRIKRSSMLQKSQQQQEFVADYKTSLLTSSFHYESTYKNGSIANKVKKYNDILASCQTNINYLTTIKNSILERKLNKKASDEHRDSAADSAIKSTDYYLQKIDEIIIKWKMLDSMVSENSKYCLGLQEFFSELKSIKNRMEIITKVFKQLTQFESLDELEKKLNELKENQLSLENISNEISEKKNYFLEYSNQDNSYAEENDDSLKEMSDNLEQIDELYTRTKHTVQSNISNIQKIYDSWSITEKVSNKLKAEFERYYMNLNQSKSGIPTYDLIGTNVHQNQIAFTQLDLREIRITVELFKDHLSELETELKNVSCCSQHTFYNSYSLLLDRFKSNIKILGEILAEKNQKSNSHCNRNNLINHDFQKNLDQSVIQFDPRADQLSTPRQQDQKIYIDKSVATIEEKSSQTENSSTIFSGTSNYESFEKSIKVSSKVNHVQFESLDSGIMCNNSSKKHSISNVSSKNNNEILDLNNYKKIDVLMNLKQNESPSENQKKSNKPLIIDELEKKREQIISEPIIRKRKVKLCSKPLIESISLPKTKNSFEKAPLTSSLCSKIFRFTLFIFIAFLVFALFLWFGLLSGIVLPSCCDFRMDSVMFNFKTYRDGPLPH